MLQAPTSDRKTKADASAKTAEPLPEWEQSLQLMGGVGQARQSQPLQQRENLAELQKAYGNQAVLRMKGRSHTISPLSPGMPLLQRQYACGGGYPRWQKKPGIQTKLKISEPGDKYEQEADQIADQVMQIPEPPVQHQIEPEAKEIVQTKKTSKEAISVSQDQAFSKDQGSHNQGLVGMSPLLNQVLNSPGHPLDTETRTFMESRFGYDFGFVKLHTDTSASASTKEIGALAYTVKNHIVLNEQSYAPTTPKGKKLLAHELTHVVQQSLADSSESSSMQGNQQRYLSSMCSAVTPHVARSVDDWLTTSVNVSAMSYTELLSEIDELSQFLQRQTESSADTVRIEEALTRLRSEAARREAATRRRTRPPSRRRGSRTVTSDSSAPLRRPRILMETTSVAYEDPQEMRAEFDLIMEWLAREDLSTGDHQILTLERDNLAPQLQQDRQRIVQERHAARLATALTPDDENAANTLEQLARTIQMIETDSGNPAIAYLYHRGERLAISSEQAETLRHGLLQQLIHTSNRIESRASYYWERYNSQLAINRDSPIIASISGWLADVEDPGDELMQRYFWVIHRLRALRARARAGRIVEAAAIMAPIEQASQEIRTLARAFYEGHIEGAEIAVSRLEFTRDAAFTIAGSIATVVAAPVVVGVVGGLGATGATAAILTTGGTGLVVGTGTAVVRGGSAATGELIAGGSLEEATEAFRGEALRGFREGFINGAAGGAARVLGPALGIGTQVGQQALRRVAAEAIVNGTSAMVDVLWQGGSIENAVVAGLSSAALSVPGAVVGGSNSPIVRELGGPMTAGASAYLGAIANGASPEDAMRSAGVAVTTSILLNRSSHPSEVDAALETQGRSFGESARSTVSDMGRRARSVTAATLIGTADALPPVRSGYGGSAAITLDAELPAVGTTHSSTPPPPASETVIPSALPSDSISSTPPTQAVDVATPPQTVSQTGAQPLTETGASQPVTTEVVTPVTTQDTSPPTAIPESTASPATVANPLDPEIAWNQLREELGNQPAQPTSTASAQDRIEESVGLAQDASWIDAQGDPQGVDLAVQEHGHAPLTREALDHTGQTRQSAHIGATSLLRSITDYSRRTALTVLLDPARHRAFDRHWMRWISNRRRALRAFGSSDFTAPLSDVLDAQRQAIRQIPNLTDRQRSTMEFLLAREFHILASGLPDGLATRVPLPAVLGS